MKDIQVTLDEEFQDIIMEDMRRVRFKTLDLGLEFYKNMLKFKILELGRMGYAKVEEMDIQFRRHLNVLQGL